MASAEHSGFRFLRAAQTTQEWPWFQEHYHQAPREILDFLAADALSIKGQHVADIGCGDGIIDLGLVHAGSPAQLVGFDLEPTDTRRLAQEARTAGVISTELPDALTFRTSSAHSLPAEDHSFDTVISWSAFEHIKTPVGVLNEIARVLKPTGVFFLQIWPLYYSAHGSHLWPWYPDGYAQLRHSPEQLTATVTAAEASTDQDNVKFILDEAATLNRITVNELQRALLAAGLVVAKFELITGATHVDRVLARYPLTDLGISGIKLLAVPA